MKIDLLEFEKRCRRIANILEKNKVTFVYGVPRGGLIPAVRISHMNDIALLTTLDKSIPVQYVAIIDEILDSGETRKKYSQYNNFFVLVNKKEEKINEWVTFFWEEEDEQEKKKERQLKYELQTQLSEKANKPYQELDI